MQLSKFVFVELINKFQCMLCGWVTTYNQGICPSCFFHLKQSMLNLEKSKDAVYGLKNIALWEWDGSSSQLTSKILNLQKDIISGSGLWKSLAQSLVTRGQYIFEKIDSAEDWIIVPSPSRQNNDLDHARNLANEVAKLLNIKLLNLLKRTNLKVNQKKLNRRDRKLHQGFRMKPISREGKVYQNVIFIDDVITTGSTTAEAFIHLGQPTNFYSWTLARRLKYNSH